MIHCLSCKKYPVDTRTIPNGSAFPADRFIVKLLSYEEPSSVPQDGSDVEELPDGMKFAYGSLLYVVSGENSTPEVFVYVDDENGFVAWDSNIVPEA